MNTAARARETPPTSSMNTRFVTIPALAAPEKNLAYTPFAKTVVASIKQALAVDITAASAAASTRPLTPAGSTVVAISAKALSGFARSGRTTLAALPTSAPAKA